MNTRKLIQQQGYDHYEFVLKDKTLSVKQIKIAEIKEYTIELENIGHYIFKEKHSSTPKYLMSIFWVSFSLILFVFNATTHSKHMNAWVWFSLSFAYTWFGATTYLNWKNSLIKIVEGEHELELLMEKPSVQMVNEFVEEIIKRSKAVKLEKYGTVDPDLPEKLMISRLNWLNETGVLDDEELNKRREQYFSLRQVMQ